MMIVSCIPRLSLLLIIKGLSLSKSANVFKHGSSTPRIIGGDDATAEDGYTWFARGINSVTYPSWKGCGGSLITPEFVLSAAHCSWDSYDGFQIGALCSPYGPDSADNCGQNIETFGSQAIFDHPQYNSFTSAYDFSLIQLNGQSSNEPVPIDQGNVSVSYSDGDKLWAIGFGNTNTDIPYYPSRLKHVEVSYINTQTCNSDKSYDGRVEDNMFCAADPSEDSCQGDSGGPLFDKNSNTLVGVTSWGYGCAQSNYPGVYSNIANQWPWIREVVCENHSNLNYPLFCEGYSRPPTTAPSTTPPTISAQPSFVDTAIIDNGVIMLGIQREGHLNAIGGDPDAYEGETTVGLRYFRDGGWYESTAFGCDCEGFGVSGKRVSDNALFWGGANGNYGTGRLSVTRLQTDGISQATTTTIADDTLQVTHEYKPSNETLNMYQVTVTFKNMLETETISELRYRRMMDWDIPPDLYNECVSLFFDSAPKSLEYTTDNGFENINPLDDVSENGYEFSCPNGGDGCPIFDSGPNDHGALFQFLFRNDNGLIELGPRETFSFDMLYGAASSKAEAYEVIQTTDCEIVSLAYPPTEYGCNADNPGTPNVFILGFRGVGGSPLEPVPSSTPVIVPSASPSISDVPSLIPSLEPTNICQGGGNIEVTLQLETDDYPFENSWSLVQLVSTESTVSTERISRSTMNISMNAIDDVIIIETSPSYNECGTNYEYQFCLLPSACYQFEIRDSYGDGFLGLSSGYNFTATLQNDDIALLSSYGVDPFLSQDSIYFGSNCSQFEIVPTPTPTPTPSSFENMFQDISISVGISSSGYSFGVSSTSLICISFILLSILYY